MSTPAPTPLSEAETIDLDDVEEVLYDLTYPTEVSDERALEALQAFRRIREDYYSVKATIDAQAARIKELEDASSKGAGENWADDPETCAQQAVDRAMKSVGELIPPSPPQPSLNEYREMMGEMLNNLELFIVEQRGDFEPESCMQCGAKINTDGHAPTCIISRAQEIIGRE